MTLHHSSHLAVERGSNDYHQPLGKVVLVSVCQHQHILRMDGKIVGVTKVGLVGKRHDAPAVAAAAAKNRARLRKVPGIELWNTHNQMKAVELPLYIAVAEMDSVKSGGMLGVVVKTPSRHDTKQEEVSVDETEREIVEGSILVAEKLLDTSMKQLAAHNRELMRSLR